MNKNAFYYFHVKMCILFQERIFSPSKYPPYTYVDNGGGFLKQTKTLIPPCLYVKVKQCQQRTITCLVNDLKCSNEKEFIISFHSNLLLLPYYLTQVIKSPFFLSSYPKHISSHQVQSHVPFHYFSNLFLSNSSAIFQGQATIPSQLNYYKYIVSENPASNLSAFLPILCSIVHIYHCFKVLCVYQDGPSCSVSPLSLANSGLSFKTQQKE